MDLFNNLSLCFFSISLGLFLFRRLKRYLRYLQQEDYDGNRFLQWIIDRRGWDRRGTLIAISGILLEILGISPILILSCGFFVLAILEKNPEHYGKKTLIRTERANRLLWTAWVLGIFLSLLFLISYGKELSLLSLILSQGTPLLLILSLAVLWKDEKKRQRKLLLQAKHRFLAVNPLVIGITGSYGKTTTKHFLSKLLHMTLGRTFYPGKGINTPMGITREITTSLRDRTPYAVIEMAAYNEGSISHLCSLTPPHGAILTTIGIAHLERFKSLETIRKAKSELAQAVPKEGFLVLNGDDPNCRRIGEEHPKKTMLYYGFKEDLGFLDLKISIEKIDEQGTEFSFFWKGKYYRSKVPIFGKPQIANLGAAFAAVCNLGATPHFAASALSLLDPVDNRLNLSKEGSTIYLMDAYNSNPSGFESALDVLSALKGNRRILMTPGMVELGSLQTEENERIASLAKAKGVDIALIIGEKNRPALKRGLLNGGLLKECIHEFDTHSKAWSFLKSIEEPGDVILIENDLLDLYETKERF